MNKQYYQSRTGFITQSALIAALYVVLTMIVAPIAFGPIQFRDNNGVGKDRRNTYQPFIFLSKIVRTNCPDQSCNTSEHYIQRCCTAKQISKEAANGNTWNCTG